MRKPVYEMSAAELVEEARRRDELRARGEPLTPRNGDTVQRIAEDDSRLEKEIQRDVWKRYIAFGCVVYWLSQARETKQTAGLGDLYVIHRRRREAWWHETKTLSGKQSSAQVDFENWNREAGITVVVGGILAAEEQLVAIGAAVRHGDRIEPAW